jgi:hypothetical protein
MRASVKSMIWLGAIGVGVVWSGTGLAQFLGIVLLTWVGMVPFSTRKVILKKIQEEKDLTDPVTVEFSESGLAVERSNWKGNVAWAFYRVFREDEQYFELAHSLGNAAHTVIFPKRAFASDEGLEAFRRLASAGISKAH